VLFLGQARIVVVVPPNFRRFLPLILIAVFVLFLVPTLLRKKSSTGTSAGVRAARTIEAMSLIDKGERAFLSANGRFTPHLADLLTGRLANDLAIGITVQLDVSGDGHRYVAQIASDVLSLVRSRDQTKLLAQSCLALSSSSGVSCPAPAK
jgi:hypothetical protein